MALPQYLNLLIKQDNSNAHNLAILKKQIETGKNLGGQTKFKYLVKRYEKRQSTIKENTKSQTGGVLKRFKNWFGISGHSIGVLPLIPIAIVAVTGTVAGAVAINWYGVYQESQKDAKMIESLQEMYLKETDPQEKEKIRDMMEEVKEKTYTKKGGVFGSLEGTGKMIVGGAVALMILPKIVDRIL